MEENDFEVCLHQPCLVNKHGTLIAGELSTQMNTNCVDGKDFLENVLFAFRKQSGLVLKLSIFINRFRVFVYAITQFENWQATLIESGKRAYPGRNPETMIFHRVHSAFAEVKLTLRSAHQSLYSF